KSAVQPGSVGLGFRVIPALGGGAQQFQPYRVSVSLPDCRLRLLQRTNNPLLNLRKTASLALRAVPFAPGRPNRSGHERKTNTCFARIASPSLVFSARTPKPALHGTAPFILAFRSPLARAGKRKIATNTRRAPNGIALSAGTSWRNGPVHCRKVRVSKSKANGAIASTRRRNPIAAFAWLKSMPTPSWRWIARTDSPFPLLNQSPPTNPSTERFAGQ